MLTRCLVSLPLACCALVSCPLTQESKPQESKGCGGGGRGEPGAIGSCGHIFCLASAGSQASDSNGRRNPTGESPGIRNRCRARSIHKLVCYSGPLFPRARCSGNT